MNVLMACSSLKQQVGTESVRMLSFIWSMNFLCDTAGAGAVAGPLMQPLRSLS